MKIINFVEEFVPENEAPLEFFVAVGKEDSACEFGSLVKNIKELADGTEGSSEQIVKFDGYTFNVPVNYEDMSWDEKIVIVCDFVAQQGNYTIDYPTVFYKGVD